MKSNSKIAAILKTVFTQSRITPTLNHYDKLIQKYQDGDWQDSLSSVSKFVEAVLKCLYIYCGQTLPPARRFSVGRIVAYLGQLPNGQFDDTVRILIPKACIFIYDITSNRGARHDPEEIDSNKMDSIICVSTSSWILAELIRFADSGNPHPDETMRLVEKISEKKYPWLEEIGDRKYINFEGISARNIGLLLLYGASPDRIRRVQLIDYIKRHQFKSRNAEVAADRLKGVVDINKDGWKLRITGKKEAEELISKLEN